MRIPFTKVESIGNDFVLVETAAVAGLDLCALAQDVCRRHYSVGSDGLLVVDHQDGEVLLRMFNPDGTEDFCGNGIRCAARYAFDQGWVGPHFRMAHTNEFVDIQVEGDQIISLLEPPSLDPLVVPNCADAPLVRASFEVDRVQLSVTSINTGSTHLVIHCQGRPTDQEFFELGPRLELHPMFPRRTSAIWCWPLGSDGLGIRIWERGVGETQGCGTGSCAAAVASVLPARRPASVHVENPGGTVQVSFEDPLGPLQFVGRAYLVFSGDVSHG